MIIEHDEDFAVRNLFRSSSLLSGLIMLTKFLVLCTDFDDVAFVLDDLVSSKRKGLVHFSFTHIFLVKTSMCECLRDR